MIEARNLWIAAVGSGALLGSVAALAVNPVMKPPEEPQWRKDIRALAMSRTSYRFAMLQPEDLYPVDTTDQIAPMFTVEISSMAEPGFQRRAVFDYGKPVAEEAVSAETVADAERQREPVPALPPAADPQQPVPPAPRDARSTDRSPFAPDPYPQNASVELDQGDGNVTVSAG